MSDQIIRIERKSANLEAAAEQLLAALRRAERLDVTPADAAATSGLPLALCQEALFHLATRFPTRVRVGEAGTLRFTFTSLEPPPSNRLKELLARHADALKICGLLVLLPPFFLNAASHAMALAEASLVPGLLAIPVKLVGWAFALGLGLIGFGTFLNFLWLPVTGMLVLGWGLFEALPAVLKDPQAEFWGMIPYIGCLPLAFFYSLGMALGSWILYRHYIFGDRGLMARSLWRNVMGLLFGPGRTRHDELEDERRLTGLIVKQRGVLSIADLIGLFGWTPEEADEQLARILLDYGGDVMVTEEGAVLYRFDPMRAAETKPHDDLRPCYEREAAYPGFWNAPPSFLKGLGAILAVGLAGLTLHGKLNWFPHLAPSLWGDGGILQVAAASGPTHLQALGIYPYLLILLPIALRYPLWERGRDRHQARLRFLKVVKLAVEHANGKYVKPPKGIKAELARLGGDLDVDRTRADGKVWLHFPRLAAAQAAAERVRAELNGARPEEAIAYDTGA